MKALILGGTGAMGKSLSKLLETRGDVVYVTSRRVHENSQNLHYILGDAHDNTFLNNILSERWDVIVDFMKYSVDEFKQRYEKLLQSTSQYVFISSSRVYSDKDIYITEKTSRLLDVSDDNEFLATNEYSLSKAREENLLLSSPLSNYTIVRPYITYNEGRLQLGELELASWLPRALEGKPIIFSRDLLERDTTLTCGKDVAKGVLSLLGTTTALGEVYNITSNQVVKWSYVLKTYLDSIERYTKIRPQVKYIETSLYLKNKATKYQILYDRYYNRRFDNSKLLSIATSLQFTKIEDGLDKCIKLYIDKKDVSGVSYIQEAIFDKISNVSSPIINIPSLKNKILYICIRYLNLLPILNLLR